MNRTTTLALALSIGLGAFAQELPKASPAASVEQRIGLTDVSVQYSRPAARGRAIFGDLVPYGEVWRTGANECTKFTTSGEITFGGEALEAGTYALFTIPAETGWTVIVSHQTNLWGNTGYTEESDVFRTMAMPTASDYDENFTIAFKNVGEDRADLVIEWAETSVAIPIEVDVASKSAQNVASALEEAKSSYRNAADFYSNRGQHEKAIETIDLALRLDPNNWYTNWVKAEILFRAGKVKDAKTQGTKAIEMGQEFYDSRGSAFNYRAGLEKEMKDWR